MHYMHQRLNITITNIPVGMGYVNTDRLLVADLLDAQICITFLCHREIRLKKSVLVPRHVLHRWVGYNRRKLGKRVCASCIGCAQNRQGRIKARKKACVRLHRRKLRNCHFLECAFFN